MNEERLCRLAVVNLGALIIVILVSVAFTRFHDTTLYASTEAHNSGQEAINKAHSSISYQELKHQLDKAKTDVYTDPITGMAVEEIGRYYIKIRKAEQEQKILLEDLYMDKSIRITVEGLTEKEYTKQDVSTSEEAEGAIQKIKLTYQYNPQTFLYSAVYELKMDRIYIEKIYETKNGIYITLSEPHDVYDKIVVLDAGHGGNDTGTYTENMEYFEKDINLSVILYLKELLDKQNSIKVYYSRLSDEKVYLNPRLNLANDLDADLFISVHCNSSEYKGASGTEVLYDRKGKKDRDITSKELASICLDEVSAKMGTKKRGLVKNEDIYIVKNAEVPVALIELGFMSNSDDMKMLNQGETRKLAAKGIYKAIEKAFEKIEKD